MVPNRVTHQHCVALLCQQGKTGAATALIEKEGLRLNESVLMSLLSSHARNNDSEGVARTLKSLDQVGVGSKSSQVLLHLANSYGEAGRAQQVEETLAQVDEEGIKLSDADVFRLMSSTSQGGLTDLTTSIATSRIQRTPNFDILRNFLPVLARIGNISCVSDIYATSLQNKKKKERHQKSDSTLDGLFLIRAMLESHRDIDSILKSVIKIQEAASNKVYIEHLVLEAAKLRSEGDCVQLVETLKKDDKLTSEINFEKVIQKLAREHKTDYNGNFETSTLMSISRTLKNLKAMDLPVPFGYIGNYLIPGMLDLDRKSPLITAQELGDLLPFINWSYRCNLVLGAVFKVWSEKNLRHAANFILNVDVGHARPNIWKLSFANSYMKTGNVELFINVVAGAMKSLRNDDKDLDKERDALFASLYHIRINSRNDELLVPILEELNKTKIGIPPSQASRLASLVTSNIGKELLASAVTEWEQRDQYWTKEREEQFLEERKDQNRINAYKKLKNSPRNPHDVMISIQNELQQKNEVNGKLADSLVKSHLEKNELEEALSVINHTQKFREDFFLSPSVLDLLVDKMIEAKRPTIDLVLDSMSEKHGRKIFLSSLINSLADLAKHGHHQQVLSILENFNPNLVLMERGANASALLKVYSDKGDVRGVEEIFTCLLAHGLGNTEYTVNLLPLIDVHLVNDDLSSAISEYLRLTRLYKKMPRKFELTSRLIQEEDIQGIQALLETSIEIIGEAKSLYDLAFCFLQLGKKNQGRKLFETGGLSFEKGKMMFFFDSFQQSGNMQACDDLVEISKGIFGCDRDFMYHRLVLLHKSNPDKVREIVKKIEEENVIPSYILQNEINSILNEGKAVENQPQNLDDEVERAIECNDIPKAMDIILKSFVTGSTSLKCKREFIDRMLYFNKIPEACEVATQLANHFPDPEKIMFKGLYQDLLHKLHPSKRATFLMTLNPAFRKILKDGEGPYQKKKSLIQTQKDLDMLEAFNENNMNKVLAILATREPTARSVNQIFHRLLKEERLEEASQVAQMICQDSFLDQFHYHTKQNIDALLRKYRDKNDVEKISEFVSKLSPRANLLLRGEIWIKASMIKSSPEAYIERMLDHQEDSKKWMVNTEVLLDAVQVHPSLPERLEELAKKGFVPAITMLAKLRLAEEKMEEFEKLVIHVPQVLLSSKKGGLFDRIDTREKMVTTLNSMRKLNLERLAASNIANCYLSINKNSSKFGDMATTVIEEDGLKIRDFARSLLVRLSNDNQFKYQAEARKFMDLVQK